RAIAAEVREGDIVKQYDQDVWRPRRRLCLRRPPWRRVGDGGADPAGKWRFVGVAHRGSPPTVVTPGLDPGLDPGVNPLRIEALRRRWIAGSSPAMTGEIVALSMHLTENLFESH